MPGEAAGGIDHPRVLQGRLGRYAFGEDPRTPLPPLGDIAPREPEAVHRSAEAEIFLSGSLHVTPLERQAQVVVLVFEASERVRLLGTEQFVACRGVSIAAWLLMRMRVRPALA